MSPAGKHVAITGGGSGVGAAIARSFSEAGARVTIFGRTEATLAAQELPFQVCDVTEASNIATAFATARQARGPIDIAIANAGIVESLPFDRTSPEIFENLLSVNLMGVVNTWQAALDDMKAAGWGRMVAIASTAGLKGYPYVSAYCAAKHGVVGLTRSLAVELAASGITVNAICPSYIETPLLERAIATITAKTGKSEEETINAMTANNPQGRFIHVDEVADTTLWLCSDSARSVNGHCLTMSGGEV